jgi:xanthosine utilization system XapX-like protein
LLISLEVDLISGVVHALIQIGKAVEALAALGALGVSGWAAFTLYRLSR